ncbi:hypothetical protein MXB_753 [Myxobolus squamalis]|nr:hypothetical protein MXB_753 [Myxobolus squamalis]
MLKYMFFIAAENSHCQEYATEKYWTALIKGAIPIVVGYPSNLTNLIPGSYINAFDFRHPMDLANYLKQITKNKEEYIKYHEWRQKYYILPYEFDSCKILDKITQLLEMGDTEDPNIHKITDESVCIDQNVALNLLVQK